jgi:hypothetical protein
MNATTLAQKLWNYCNVLHNGPRLCKSRRWWDGASRTAANMGTAIIRALSP